MRRFCLDSLKEEVGEDLLPSAGIPAKLASVPYTCSTLPAACMVPGILQNCIGSAAKGASETMEAGTGFALMYVNIP